MSLDQGPIRIAVVSALTAESRTMKQVSNRLELHTCGMGSDAVEKHLANVSTQNISGIISWGVCGALKNQLKPGDLLIPKMVTNQNQQTFKCDALWRKTIQDTIHSENHNSGMLNSLIVDSGKTINTPQAKTALAKLSNAEAVDMESFAIAKFAHAHEIPFVIIRVVVDTANDCLPEKLAFELGESSASLKTFVRAISQPRQWPTLIRTGSQFRVALASLKMLANTSIDALSMTCIEPTPE